MTNCVRTSEKKSETESVLFQRENKNATIRSHETHTALFTK